MRRSAGLVLVIALALQVLGGSASAVPTVGFKARFGPIQGFPETGYVLGAGATLETEYSISGTEYGGFPPPLIGMNVYLPEGTLLGREVSSTCPVSTLEQTGLCPKDSEAGPVGRVRGVVSFGSERVQEELTVQPYLAVGGGIVLYMFGHSPTVIKAITQLHEVAVSNRFGEGLIGSVPLIETVPGAPDASFEAIDVSLGSAYRTNGNTISYLTVPRTCPQGEFAVKTELLFAGLGGLAPQTVPVTYKMPCPKGSAPEASAPQTSVPGTGGVVTAPSNKVCVSRRNFTIHVVQIKGLSYREVDVDVNGHRVDAVRGRRVSARVDLRGLPKGLYTVRITVTTTSGRRITGTRAYHTCAPKPLHPRGQPRL